MGDPEDAVIPPSDGDTSRVDSDLTCDDLGDNLSQDCADDAIVVADNQGIVPGPSTNEGVAYNSDKTSMCGEASLTTVDIVEAHKEAISDESGDSSDIEVLRESPVDDQRSGMDRMQYSVDDLNTHGDSEQCVDIDESRSSTDRASYDNDDQITLKSDNLTYSASGKVASEQSTDSESCVGGSEGDSRGSHVTSSESECDTYNVQQEDSQTTESVSQNDDVRLGCNVDNQCEVNSLEDAEALINDASVRPRSLSLLKQGFSKEKPRRSKRGSESSSQSGCSSSTDALIEAASSVPLQGTITHDGDMVAFVAEDLNSMIKMSSPISRTDDSSNTSLSGKRTPRSASFGSVSSSASGWSVSASSASGWSYSAMSRSPSIVTQSPDDVPPIDPRVVDDLEMHTNKVAENLHHMMSTLRNHMQKMSAVTYSCLDVYGESVDNTCNCVDSSIKSMYALMAKNEELAREMQPVNALHEQIKEINRLLDVFDLQMARDEK